MNGDELKKEFGDYQTPEDFASAVCEVLRNKIGLNPKTIIEPTSGIGNFISASLNIFESIEKAYGLEINEGYCTECKKRIDDDRLKIVNDNFFTYDIEEFISDGETLFIGNPPWATNSELNFNLPNKENFKRLNGTDAITGASNFDICEYIILKLIEKSVKKNVSIAMLCKTSVARNVLQEIDRNNWLIECVRMYNFNSSKVFGISAPACLLFIKMSLADKHVRTCDIFDIESPDNLEGQVLFEGGKLKVNVHGVTDLDGICSMEWRQGVKHDCASVMELTKIDNNRFINKKKEEIELEETLVFPLIKSSSFKQIIIDDNFSKYVIVTQKKARENTDFIRELSPLTWEYLCKYKKLFDGRKSSIYKGAPAFSMFGVGDYSYSPYKVGISGFYKTPLFSLIYNKNNISHPIMLDDTSYFLSFDNYDNAYVCMLLLNSEKVQNFFLSISFQDAKRPYTKKVLQRLDLKKCIEKIDLSDLEETEKKFKLETRVNIAMYNSFKEVV